MTIYSSAHRKGCSRRRARSRWRNPCVTRCACCSLTLEPEAFDPATSARGFTLAVNNYAARARRARLWRATSVRVAPRVSLDIRPIGMLDVLDQLDAGGIDVALGTLVDGGERFKCVRVTDDDYVAVLDEAHPARGTAALSVEPWRRSRTSSSPRAGTIPASSTRRWSNEGWRARSPRGCRFFPIVLMLVGSDRLAVVPRRVANDLARICPLAVRELPFASPRIALSMIWHRRLDNHAAQRWLRDMIKASTQS